MGTPTGSWPDISFGPPGDTPVFMSPGRILPQLPPFPLKSAWETTPSLESARPVVDISGPNAYNDNMRNLVSKGLDSMAILNIRNLPDEVHSRLRVRAARAGRSMEAEVREILTEICMKKDRPVPPSTLQGWVEQIYGEKRPENVVDDLIAERRREASRE